MAIKTLLLSEPFALKLPAHFAGYSLHEPQVALPEPGIWLVAHAAQRAVGASIREHDRYRGVGAYVRLAGHPEVFRQIFAPGIGNHIGEATVEHPLAVGLLERKAFAFSPPEGFCVPLQRAEDQPVPRELRDERDVHLQGLPYRGKQPLYRLRRLATGWSLFAH